MKTNVLFAALLVAGSGVATVATAATPATVAAHAMPVMTSMAASPQLQQMTTQLTQQQARIDQLETKLDALLKTGGGTVAPNRPKLSLPAFRPPPRPAAKPQMDTAMAAKAAGMRVLSTKMSSVATTAVKPTRIVVDTAAAKIPLLAVPAVSGGGTQTDQLTNRQRIDQLTHTVNTLLHALAADEHTIQQLSDAQFATNLRVVNDEINAANLADNASAFETSTTTALGNHLDALYGIWSGVMDSYTLACQDMNAVNYSLSMQGGGGVASPQPLAMQGWWTTNNYTCQ